MGIDARAMEPPEGFVGKKDIDRDLRHFIICEICRRIWLDNHFDNPSRPVEGVCSLLSLHSSPRVLRTEYHTLPSL